MAPIDVEFVFQIDPNECFHTTVEYGHCMTNEFFKGDGCKYRTFAKDYKIK